MPTREPPHEQMLVGMGWASWPVPRRLPSLSSSLPIVVPPPTTPRAAAREAGGAWGVVRGRCGGGPPSQRCGVWVEGG